MKTNYLLNAALVVALSMNAAGCTNDLTDSQAPQENTGMSIIASLPTNADTRLGYDDSNNSKLALTWKTGDALSVFKTDFATAATTFTLDASTDGTKNGTFSTVASPGYAESDKLIAIYPQGSYTSDANGLQLSVADQSGTLAASPHHYMQATTMYKDGETPAFTFSHLMAAVKLEMTFSNKNEGDKVKGISLCGSGLFDKAVMGADGTLTQAADANAIVGTLSTTEFTVNSEKKVITYLFVYPASLSNAKVTATDGTKVYEFKLTDATLAKGNVYKVVATMTEATATTWYGDGKATDYYIYNLKDLQNFAATVNSAPNSSSPKTMVGKTVHLLADIDMGSIENTPIGAIGKPFKGTFDGHGKTISNLNNNSSSAKGLFGYVTDAMIKNMTVTGTVAGGSTVGGIVGSGSGAIINCVNRVNVTGTSQVGGIAGSYSGTMIACENFGTVIHTGSQKAGGITGNSGGGNIIACINHGSINAAGVAYVGGISGLLNLAEIKLLASINEGGITAGPGSGSVVGSANLYSEIKANYFTNNSSFKFAGEDNQSNGWNSVTGNTYTEINNKVTEMNAAIDEWNTAQTDENLKCPYEYQISSTPDSALPILVKK